MSARVQRHSGAARSAEAELARANEALRLEQVQGALDVAGVVDPTPISDVTGAALSLYRGDVIGAGLSLVSVVPYLGDALAKTAKGARAVRRVQKLGKTIADGVGRVRTARLAARRAATAEVRAERAAEAARKTREAANCATCRKPPNRFGTRLPADGKGTWAGEKGASTWTPDPKLYPDAKPVRYRDGYPDFSPHATERVEIEFTPGNRDADFLAARDAVRAKTGNPKWRKPEGSTWHHNQDGVTMELVPTDTHAAAQHAGGFELVEKPGY